MRVVRENLNRSFAGEIMGAKVFFFYGKENSFWRAKVYDFEVEGFRKQPEWSVANYFM